MDLHLRAVGKAVSLCRLLTRSLDDLARRQGIPMSRPAARAAPQPAAHPQPAPNAAQPTTPSQPPIPEGRHERRRRERAERHLAAAQHRAGPATASESPLHQRLRAEVAAPVAATAEAVAA